MSTIRPKDPDNQGPLPANLPDGSDVDSCCAAAREMLAHIDAHEDAMGHGYCATQSGDYMDSCTCGFQEQHDRWQAAVARKEQSDE